MLVRPPAVVATVDRAASPAPVPVAGSGADVVPLEVCGKHPRADVRAECQARAMLQRQVETPAVGPVVPPACELDVATAVVPDTVAAVGVAEVPAAAIHAGEVASTAVLVDRPQPRPDLGKDGGERRDPGSHLGDVRSAQRAVNLRPVVCDRCPSRPDGSGDPSRTQPRPASFETGLERPPGPVVHDSGDAEAGAPSGTSAVPVVDRLETPDRSRGRPVVAAGRADAEVALDVLDEPTPAVPVPAPEWQPSRDVPVGMRRVLPVHLLAVPMRLPAVATIPVAMVAASVPVRVPAGATASLLALRVAVDVAVPVGLVAVPAPRPGTLCVATGPVSVVVTPHHLCGRADRPTLSVRLGQVSRGLGRRERGDGGLGNGRRGHELAGQGNDGHHQRDGGCQGGKTSRRQQGVGSGEVALVAEQARTPSRCWQPRSAVLVRLRSPRDAGGAVVRRSLPTGP